MKAMDNRPVELVKDRQSTLTTTSRGRLQPSQCDKTLYGYWTPKSVDNLLHQRRVEWFDAVLVPIHMGINNPRSISFYRNTSHVLPPDNSLSDSFPCIPQTVDRPRLNTAGIYYPHLRLRFPFACGCVCDYINRIC